MRLVIGAIFFGFNLIFDANVPYFIFWPLRKLAFYVVSSILGGLIQLIPLVNIPVGFLTLLINIINLVIVVWKIIIWNHNEIFKLDFRWKKNKFRKLNNCFQKDKDSLIQANSILSRWKDAPSHRMEVPNLELIANLVNSGAGIGILPRQVVKAQRYALKRVANTPSYKDRLAVVCYPEILKSREGKMIFEELKKSFKA